MRVNRGKRSKHDLEDMLSAVERELGITLTIQDCHGVFRLPDGASLINPARLSQPPNSPCAGVQSDQCHDECTLGLDHRAQKESRPFVFSCWKQLIKLIVPIRCHGGYLGTIVAGTWQPESYDLLEWDEGEWDDWENATAHIPVFDPMRIERLGRILDGVSIAVADIWDESLAVEDGNRDAREILRFIRSMYWQPLKLNELADHLGVSSSHASHMVTGIFNRSFRELLRDERISAAELLLKQTDFLVGEIAGLVGIADEQHFNRLFKKVRGSSPGQYRRSHKPHR